MTPLAAADAQTLLAEADAARRSAVVGLRLPRGYSLLTGTGNVLVVFGVALGYGSRGVWQLGFVAGLAAQVALASLAVRRFKDCNGVWVSGLGGPNRRGTLPVILVFMATLLWCVVLATWLMVEDHPVLSGLVALAAFPVTYVADRWWMARSLPAA